jgi:hypothetical protein
MTGINRQNLPVKLLSLCHTPGPVMLHSLIKKVLDGWKQTLFALLVFHYTALFAILRQTNS